MKPSARFRINTPAVVHETFDDEVVLIHFDTGTYYSLDSIGARIWGLIQSGATVADIIEGITNRYEGSGAAVEQAVNELLAELQTEDLITLLKADPASTKRPEVRVEDEPVTESPPFEAPRLRKYTDMQDLLLLDPIHEVDETGWPSAQSELPNEDR